MNAKWQDLESEVRSIANTIWGGNFQSVEIFGRQIDAYAQLSRQRAIAIEVTTQRSVEKLQVDLNKLIHVRNSNSAKHLLTECYCVVSYPPTTAMINVCGEYNIDLYTVEQFRLRFLPFDKYLAARSAKPFGSAVDPKTGAPDQHAYVVVQFESEDVGACTVATLVDLVISNKKVILTGEYGTGKSKCLSQMFTNIASLAWEKYRFPISIDLRRSWGLKDRYEIIRRHLQELNLGADIERFIAAYNDGYFVLLIDGFDELATHIWSDDPEAMRDLRYQALEGVRDLISNQKGGLIVCGRDHYFDSSDEMLGALGMISVEPITVRSNEEFSYEEISEFLENAGYSYPVPEWLPRKPLTCEFFVKLFSDMGIELSEEVLDPVQFWDLFFDAVCQRESQMHPSFDATAIKTNSCCGSCTDAQQAVQRRAPFPFRDSSRV